MARHRLKFYNQKLCIRSCQYCPLLLPLVLGIKLRASNVVSKCCTIVLHPILDAFCSLSSAVPFVNLGHMLWFESFPTQPAPVLLCHW